MIIITYVAFKSQIIVRNWGRAKVTIKVRGRRVFRVEIQFWEEFSDFYGKDSHDFKVIVICPGRLYKCYSITGACCYFSLIKEYELRPKYNKLLVSGALVVCLFGGKLVSLLLGRPEFSFHKCTLGSGCCAVFLMLFMMHCNFCTAIKFCSSNNCHRE